MSLFTDSLIPSTISSVRNTLLGYAQAAGLIITDWMVGGVGQQMYESMTNGIQAYTVAAATTVRGYASLDTSTDPGDPDPANPGNADLPPAPGFLSNLGKNVFGTTRDEATFATGALRVVNDGPGAVTFAPDSLTFTWTVSPPADISPTYRNSADPSIYTNPDGTVTLAVDGFITGFPITAEQIGSASSTLAENITLTTTTGGLRVSGSSGAVTGVDREAADTYRARCREAPSRLSFADPASAIQYYATTTTTGTALLNVSGNPVNINRTEVSQSSVYGIIRAYFAAPSGAPSGEDVTAANTNIRINAFLAPDAITYYGTAAVAVPITVTGTAKIKRRSGMTDADLRQAAANGIANASPATGPLGSLVLYFQALPIGGVDQTAGAGVVYKTDIQGAARLGYPGLYDVQLSLPSGDTSLAVGHVATLISVPGDGNGSGNWTIQVVP